MALRFRKSVKIAPGIRVNLSGSGASVTAGPRGASVSFGKRGAYLNAGIPGTGISSRTKLSGGGSASQLRDRQEKEREKKKILDAKRELLASVTLSLNEKGNIEGVDASGQTLSSADIKLLWAERRAYMSSWLEDKCAEINGDVELLARIHMDTPAPTVEPKFSPAPFLKAPPEKPEKPTFPAKPVLTEVGALAPWRRILKKNRIDHARAIEERSAQYSRDLKEWRNIIEFQVKAQKKAISDWENRLASWRLEKKEHEVSEDKYRAMFAERIRTDAELMSSQLERAFGRMAWPRETLISYQVEEDERYVLLDVDLPEIEDLPQQLATISASGKKLNIKQKAQKQARLEYALHVHGIALRLAGVTLAELPACESVIVSGYSQRLNSGTGVINDDYLFSVKFERSTFEKINFDNLSLIDPIETLSMFEHRRKMTSTGVFKAVKPFSG